MWKYNGSTDFFAQQVIADSVDVNENDVEPKQIITHYTENELLQKLRESKPRLLNNSTHKNLENLEKIGRKISHRKHVSTVYYPYCGADVTHAFLLFPDCTTMVGFGRDDFGGIADLNFYNDNNDFTSVPLSYADGFDSHKYHEVKGSQYLDHKYKVCPDVLLRITQILGGEILSVEKNKIGEGKSDCVYQIDFMLNNIKRTFIYAKYEVNCDHYLPTTSSPVRDYLVSQSPDALLLKAIPDVLLNCEDGLALACASVSREDQIVLSDSRTFNWNKNIYQKDEPQPVFSEPAQLDSMRLDIPFGYGKTLFIGDGSQLLVNELDDEDEEDTEQTITVDTGLNSVISTARKEQSHKNESSVIYEDTIQMPQNSKQESNKSNPAKPPQTSSKSNFSMGNLKLFSPLNELYKKLSKSKEVSKETKSPEVETDSPKP